MSKVFVFFTVYSVYGINCSYHVGQGVLEPQLKVNFIPHKHSVQGVLVKRYNVKGIV